MKDSWSRKMTVCLWTVLFALSADAQVRFTDITAQAGIRFVHNNGRSGKKWLPETLGSGVAFFDADGDGAPDILLINGKSITPKPAKTLHQLYRNNKNGTFTDITKGSGLDVEMYGFGVAAADYDNDGRDDLYITALEGDRLFHNEGNGKFKEVTQSAGINNANFGTGAAWLDFDKDGKLDLFVANYVQWTPKLDVFCSLDGKTKSYCTPESYKGVAPKLYRNLGNGKFEDVSQKAGIADAKSKSLGIAVLDFDMDGWPDIFVANDTQPNKLYRNNRNGTFTETGLTAGVALGEDGIARGAMGTDAADYDGSGRPHLLVGNFANQMLALYRNEGNGLFVDQAPRSTIGRSSLLSLTFATFFFDYDLDGRLDIFCGNGHLDAEIERVQPKIKFRQPPLLFRNSGKGQFEDAGKSAGPDFQKPMVARGAAYADFDGDGDLDLLISNNDGPAVLLRNDGGNKNHWLRVKLAGTKSNRNGIGAAIHIQTASGKQWQTVHSGSSYCSQSDLAVTFGLGQDSKVTQMEVRWPSGIVQRVPVPQSDRTVLVTEQQ